MFFCRNCFFSNFSKHFLGFYSYAMVALVFLKSFFSNRTARVRKNKNKQSIFDIVFKLLV